MSARAEIMSRKRSATRPASKVAVWFKMFFVKLYVALDQTQRNRAAEIIRQYAHLIPKRDEHFDVQKMAFLSEEAGHESRQFWRDIPWT